MKLNASRVLCSPNSWFRSWSYLTSGTAAAAAWGAALEVLAPPVPTPSCAAPAPGPRLGATSPSEPPPPWTVPAPGLLPWVATPPAPPPPWAQPPIGPLPWTHSSVATAIGSKNRRTRRIWTMLRPATCSSPSKASLKSAGSAKPASTRLDSLLDRLNVPRKRRKSSDTAS